MIEDMKELPAQVEMLLNNKKNIQKFANRYLAAKDIFYIGRGIDYAIAMEGSLKMKEISYVHSEAYAGRRAEAWYDFPGRGRYTGDSYPDTGGSVQENDQ